MSPSSRRAWIEIYLGFSSLSSFLVALLAEGVDRNRYKSITRSWHAASPSSRRAWIEMTFLLPMKSLPGVALLAEGVDRNKKTS